MKFVCKGKRFCGNTNLRKIIKCYSNGEFEVNYLRRSYKVDSFFFPDVKDAASVSLDSVKHLLPAPTFSKKLTKPKKMLFRFEYLF